MPGDLALTQETLGLLYQYSYKSYLQVAVDHGPDRYYHHIAKMILYVLDFAFSLDCGIDSLLAQDIAQAFASFEYAAQIMKACLAAGMIDNTALFLEYLIKSLAYAQSRDASDITQLFLKQLAALSVIVGGVHHPVFTLAKGLLSLGITPVLSNELLKASCNGRYDAGVEDRKVTDTALFRLVCESLGKDYSLQQAEIAYHDLVYQYRRGEEGDRYLYHFTSQQMASVYLRHHRFIEAAALLSDAPDHLSEYISRGWVPTKPTSAPFSMIGIVRRLYLLAQAYAGQQNHEHAEAMFRLAIFAGQKYFPCDEPTLIRAYKAYSSYLKGLNRTTEAAEVEQMVVLGLKMYMLTV